MKSKKIGAGLLAFLMAATTAAASAQTVFAADLGTVTDNVPAITAASASVSVLISQRRPGGGVCRMGRCLRCNGL